jgi:hypothetical protein
MEGQAGPGDTRPPGQPGRRHHHGLETPWRIYVPLVNTPRGHGFLLSPWYDDIVYGPWHREQGHGRTFR